MPRSVLLLLLVFAACAKVAAQLPAAPPLPTITLRVTPPLALPGGTVWISCFVPEALGYGYLRYGVEGIRVSGPEVVQHIQNRLLIERLPCGTWTAFCQFAPYPTGDRQLRTHTLDVTAGCGGCQ